MPFYRQKSEKHRALVLRNLRDLRRHLLSGLMVFICLARILLNRIATAAATKTGFSWNNLVNSSSNSNNWTLFQVGVDLQNPETKT